jgi:hypothetical protein
MMDLIGGATYALPALGVFGYLVRAPVSALIFFRTFGCRKGAFGNIFNFMEEILPGTDFIPSFTIFWLLNIEGLPVNQYSPDSAYNQTSYRLIAVF